MHITAYDLVPSRLPDAVKPAHELPKHALSVLLWGLPAMVASDGLAGVELMRFLELENDIIVLDEVLPQVLLHILLLLLIEIVDHVFQLLRGQATPTCLGGGSEELPSEILSLLVGQRVHECLRVCVGGVREELVLGVTLGEVLTEVVKGRLVRDASVWLQQGLLGAGLLLLPCLLLLLESTGEGDWLLLGFLSLVAACLQVHDLEGGFINFARPLHLHNQGWGV